MKLHLVLILGLVCLVGSSMSSRQRRGNRGQRRREPTCSNMNRTVRQLRWCLGDVKAQNKNLQENIKNIEDENSAVQEKLKDLEDKNTLLETENQNLQTENQNLQSENENLQSENQDLQTKNQNLQSEIQIIDTKNQILQAENQDLGTEIQNLQSEIQITDTENQILQAENQVLETENQNLQSEIQIKDTENQILQAENQDLETENQNLQSEIQIKDTENQILQAENQDLETEIEELSQCCARIDGECYKAGETFTTADGCQSCTCTGDSLLCSSTGVEDCLAECTYDGEDYVAGDLFPAIEECGWCTCNADGSVSCESTANCIDSCDLDKVKDFCPPLGDDWVCFGIDGTFAGIARNMCHFDLLSDFYERCYNIVLMVLPQNTCPDQPPELEETEGIQHHKKIIKKIEALKNPPL